jgi:branched-chain amino acid transport system substrate-binding protein
MIQRRERSAAVEQPVGAGAGVAPGIALCLLVAAAVLAAACSSPGGPQTAAGGPPPAAPGAPSGDFIPVGQYGSMTGTTAAFGTSTDSGVTLAEEEINAAGGVLGRPVRVFTEDDQSKPEEVPPVITKLINQNKVVALIGEVASSRSLAAAPIAQRAKIPMISPSSTNPRVTQVGDYIFRMCYLDDFQGASMARFAVNTLGMKKGAIFRDIRNDYSVGLADFFSAEFKRLGGTVVTDENYSEGDNDFRAQLTKIRSAGPDFIYVPGYYADAAKISKQARDLGIAAPLLGGDGWESAKLFEIGGEAINGSFYSNHYYPGDQSPAVKNFVAKYKARFGSAPDSMAALGYDAMKLLAAAITRAGSPDGEAIRRALAETKGWSGVTGQMTFDQNRNPVKPIVILEIKNGGLALRETLQP